MYTTKKLSKLEYEVFIDGLKVAIVERVNVEKWRAYVPATSKGKGVLLSECGRDRKEATDRLLIELVFKGISNID